MRELRSLRCGGAARSLPEPSPARRLRRPATVGSAGPRARSVRSWERRAGALARCAERRCAVPAAPVCGVAPPVRVCGHLRDTPCPDVHSPRCACSPRHAHPRPCHQPDVHPSKEPAPAVHPDVHTCMTVRSPGCGLPQTCLLIQICAHLAHPCPDVRRHPDMHHYPPVPTHPSLCSARCVRSLSVPLSSCALAQLCHCPLGTPGRVQVAFLPRTWWPPPAPTAGV